MSHPSLGLPPRDQTVAHPGVGARIRAAAPRLATRAMELALDADPTFRTRHDELGLRALLRDADALIERIALAVDQDDPGVAGQFAEWITPIYRRRKVPLDDLITLSEGLRSAIGATLAPADFPPAGAAIDDAIRAFRWHRRLAGDGRKRNRLLAAIYKGA